MTYTESQYEFEEIVRRYWRLVVREAAKVMRDSSSADDVAQEVFMALWRSDSPPASSDHLRNWLRRVARDRSISRLRRAVLPVAEGIAPDQLVAEEVETPETWSIQLEGAISRLPGIYAESVRLRFLVGMDMAQVATALGIPLETARTRVRRGVKRLKHEFFAPPPKRDNKPGRR